MRQEVVERLRVRQAYFRRHRVYNRIVQHKTQPYDKPVYELDWLVRDHMRWHDLRMEACSEDHI